MKDAQDKIKKFNDDRDWSDPAWIKDLLLNMNEEIGEFWNLIKWVDAKEQKELIEKNKEEVEDFVGDMMYLILKIAYLCDVNSKKAIMDVLEEYEKRFPAEKIRGKHSNLKAGGLDLKYQ